MALCLAEKPLTESKEFRRFRFNGVVKPGIVEAESEAVVGSEHVLVEFDFFGLFYLFPRKRVKDI